MSVDIQVEVLILRPRADVARFMFEPRNDALWTTGVIESRSLTDGPLRRGSRVERTAKFLGRTFAYQYEVVDASERDFVEMRVEKPFPMAIRYQLDEAPEGTRASIRARGDATGFFRLAGPLLTRMVRRNITSDLETLKEYLEAQAAP